MSYTDKLYEKYQVEMELAKNSGILLDTSNWLESCLLKNKINIAVFLSFLYCFLDTSHLTENSEKNLQSIDQYTEKMARVSDTKKRCLYIFGKS